MVLYNQWLYEFSLKNESPLYHVSLCRNMSISCFLPGGEGRGSAVGPWAYGEILVISL